jgi:hypothetical protein
MAEWLKAHAWKACIGETLSRVRIPLSPPFIINNLCAGINRHVVGDERATGKGIANHPDPKFCGGDREVAVEA